MGGRGAGFGRSDSRDWEAGGSYTNGKKIVDGYSVFGDYKAADAAFGFSAADGSGSGDNDKWIASLTKKERSELEKYGFGASYYSINEQLRKEQVSKNMSGRVNAIERAIDKAELKEPIIVSRASGDDLLRGLGVESIYTIPNKPGDSSDAIRLGMRSASELVSMVNKNIGSVVVDKAFTSTTAKSGNTSWQDSALNNFVYHIKVPAGKGIGAYVGGMFDSEYHHKDVTEFLLNRGSAFRIVGAYAKDGKAHVNMQYIGREK